MEFIKINLHPFLNGVNFRSKIGIFFLNIFKKIIKTLLGKFCKLFFNSFYICTYTWLIPF
jgi:hypothetical protein